MIKARLARIWLVFAWTMIAVGILGGVAALAANEWIERNTIVVEVVDANGRPVPNASVTSRGPDAILFL